MKRFGTALAFLVWATVQAGCCCRQYEAPPYYSQPYYPQAACVQAPVNPCCPPAAVPAARPVLSPAPR